MLHIKKFQFLITEKMPFLKTRFLSFLDLPKMNCLEVYSNGHSIWVSEIARLWNEQQNWIAVNWVCQATQGANPRSFGHRLMLAGWVFHVSWVLELLEHFLKKGIIKYSPQNFDFFSMAMGADYSFELISIIYALQYIWHNKFLLGSVYYNHLTDKRMGGRQTFFTWNEIFFIFDQATPQPDVLWSCSSHWSH